MEYLNLFFQYALPALIALIGTIYTSKKSSEGVKLETEKAFKSYEMELVKIETQYKMELEKLEIQSRNELDKMREEYKLKDEYNTKMEAMNFLKGSSEFDFKKTAESLEGLGTLIDWLSKLEKNPSYNNIINKNKKASD